VGKFSARFFGVEKKNTFSGVTFFFKHFILLSATRVFKNVENKEIISILS